MDSQHALNAKTGKWGDASPVKEIIAQISGLVKTLDYSSLTFKEDYCKGGYPPLYGIVCNAGGHQHGRLKYTEDGIEEAFGVNHLGHFLLVNLLLQNMENDGRVVFVTSDTHDSDKIQFHDAGRLAYPEKFGCAEDGYPVSKLCNILLIYWEFCTTYFDHI